MFGYVLDLQGQGHLWVVDNTLHTLAAEGIINRLNNFLYIVVYIYYNWLVINLVFTVFVFINNINLLPISKVYHCNCYIK